MNGAPWAPAVLATVVLQRDIAEHGLLAGDLGAVVEVYPTDTFDVEFVTASGRTTALVTLRTSDLRAIEDIDLVSVRTISHSG